MVVTIVAGNPLPVNEEKGTFYLEGWFARPGQSIATWNPSQSRGITPIGVSLDQSIFSTTGKLSADQLNANGFRVSLTSADAGSNGRVSGSSTIHYGDSPIQGIDAQGNVTWACPHIPEEASMPCGAPNTHHISHEAIGWHGASGAKSEHQTVSLPPCQACGAQTFLKVAYTRAELQASNMWHAWDSFQDEKLQATQEALSAGSGDQSTLASQVKQLTEAKAAGGYHTTNHAAALQHVELAKQLVTRQRDLGSR